SGRVVATQTDAFGAWHLDGLDDGLHDGWIVAPGAQALRLADLTPATDPTPSGSDALVAPTASLAGHVTRNGLPQVLAEVTLVDGDDVPIATAFTGPDGGYVFDVLPPNVPVNLRIAFAGARTMAFGSPVVFGPGPNGLPDPAPAGPPRPTDVSAADAGPGDVTGPDPVAPPDAVPFDQLDPLALAKSWLDEANREPERLPADDGHLEARLGELDPDWCPQLQDAWARAKYIEQLKDDQFANVVDTHQQLYWRTLNELGLAATQATIILGKLYLAVPQLQLAGARMAAALPQLGPRLAATVGDFGVFVAGAVVDVSSIVGSVGGYLIDGNFDAIGTALNGVTQTMNEIGTRGAAITAAGATRLGTAVGALSPLSAFISIAYDVKGLVGQLDTILGTARDVLDRFTATKGQYEDAFARYADAVDAFTKVRAAGCKCPNGEPMRADGSCDKPPPPDPPAPPPPTDDNDDGHDDDGDDHSSSQTTYLNSRDPNAIDGPAGAGPGRAITADQPLGYTIHFENDPDASAPAQQVVVSTVLDPDVDLDSVELGDVGFGSVRLDVPDGRRAVELTEPLDGTPYSVRVVGDLDVDTRTLTWTFTTIDPVTGDLPTDPLAGFLPPNDTSPEGEGVIEYRARTTAGTPVGDTIDAQASIVFDDNDAIATNTWTNTIGVVLPGDAGGYHPLVPARLVDTRSGLGGSAVWLGPGESRMVQVAGLGGVPASGAAAAVLNVTAVGPSAATHLSVWPAGAPMPTASNVNVPAGQTVANLAMVRLGDGGAVELFNNAGSVDVVVDVSGWFDLGAGSTVGMPPSSPDASGGTSEGGADADGSDGPGSPTDAPAEPDGPGSAYLPLDPVRIVD
ncbi:MAG: hypothetical protein KDB36_04455, partial [Acidimicrobiales bacterium]|nr:hypothetical protein [Acidimicrobiales bacterium]